MEACRLWRPVGFGGLEAWKLCRPGGLGGLEAWKSVGLEAWRIWRPGGLGGLEAWRPGGLGGLEAWRPGGLEAWRPGGLGGLEGPEALEASLFLYCIQPPLQCLTNIEFRNKYEYIRYVDLGSIIQIQIHSILLHNPTLKVS